MASTLVLGTDTYITLTAARTYCITYGGSLPVVDADADSLLRKATLAIDRIYGNRYLGRKINASQPLYWPRTYVQGNMNNYDDGFFILDSDGNPADLSSYPVQLGYAEVELALLIQAGTDIYAQPQPVLSSERKKVDVLEKELAYATGSGQTGYRTQPLYEIGLILRPLLTSSGTYTMQRGA